MIETRFIDNVFVPKKWPHFFGSPLFFFTQKTSDFKGKSLYGFSGSRLFLTRLFEEFQGGVKTGRPISFKKDLFQFNSKKPFF